MTDDLVSVVVPTYDRGESVVGAVESALAQTHDPVEVVVVDDGSTDDTPAVLDELAGSDDRIRVVTHETNRGIPQARNSGIEAARGAYVCQLDDDDRWHPEKVERQLAALDARDHSYCGVYTYGVVRDESGDVVERVEPGVSGDLYPDILVRMTLLPHSSHLIRAECLDAVGGYDPAWTVACDWDLSIRLARRWKVACVPKPLVERTVHGDNVSRASEYDVRARDLVARKYDQEIREAGVEREFVAARERERGLFALACGEEREAREHFRNALRADPTPTHAALATASLFGEGGLSAARRVRDAVAGLVR